MVDAVNDRPVNTAKERKPLLKCSIKASSESGSWFNWDTRGLCKPSEDIEAVLEMISRGFKEGPAPSESHKVHGKAINTEAHDLGM